MNKSIILIISMCIAKRPLKPSIKFDPLTIKRKHSNTKIMEKMKLIKYDPPSPKYNLPKKLNR